MLRTFKTVTGSTISVDVPHARASASVFVVAGHKTGSVLLNNIVRDIAAEAGLPAVPLESIVWGQGFDVAEWPDEIFEFLESPGFVFHSFRLLQKLPTVKAFQSGRKIFLVRDPRDIAVSLYFSLRQSHSLPKPGKSLDLLLEVRKTVEAMDIDEFVLTDQAAAALRNTESFAPYWGGENCTFYRYEDVIFEKRRWVAQIAESLGAEISEETCNLIADRHDLRPENENPNAHVRTVTPGDYRKKLSAESIQHIEDSHPVFFDMMGYERSTASS